MSTFKVSTLTLLELEVHMEQLTYFKPFDGQYSKENRDHGCLVPYYFILDM